ncbi:MAG TPA: YaeQ family protein [Methylophilaceae bacterium]|jgi:uncharacterized protein YaeQ
MALKATIYKVDLQIADMDRHYYQQHSLTLARHPSETDERMMVRLLAFALYADEALLFGKGLSTDDEPDLWLKDMTGTIDLWIDVGLPDEREIRKACGRAKQVIVVCYGGRSADIWWDQNREKLGKQDNLTVLDIAAGTSKSLANMASRNMQLSFTLQDGQVLLAGESAALEISPRALLRAL